MSRWRTLADRAEARRIADGGREYGASGGCGWPSRLADPWEGMTHRAVTPAAQDGEAFDADALPELAAAASRVEQRRADHAAGVLEQHFTAPRGHRIADRRRDLDRVRGARLMLPAFTLAERAVHFGRAVEWADPGPDGRPALWRIVAYAAVEEGRVIGEEAMRAFIGAEWGRLLCAWGRHRAWLDDVARQHDDRSSEERQRAHDSAAARRRYAGAKS